MWRRTYGMDLMCACMRIPLIFQYFATMYLSHWGWLSAVILCIMAYGILLPIPGIILAPRSSIQTGVSYMLILPMHILKTSSSPRVYWQGWRWIGLSVTSARTP